MATTFRMLKGHFTIPDFRRLGRKGQFGATYGSGQCGISLAGPPFAPCRQSQRPVSSIAGCPVLHLARYKEFAMSQVSSLKTQPKHNPEEWQLRVDLAAAFRLAARMGCMKPLPIISAWRFPRWKIVSHQIQMDALLANQGHDLQLLDVTDRSTMNAPMRLTSPHGASMAPCMRTCRMRLHSCIFTSLCDGCGGAG